LDSAISRPTPTVQFHENVDLSFKTNIQFYPI